MTAPVLQSFQFDGTDIYIIFDRAITSTGITGFTFTKVSADGCTTTGVTPTGPSVDENAIIATANTSLAAGETLNLVYNAAVGDVAELAAPNDPAASFNATAVNYYTASLVRRGIVGLNGDNTITIYFSEPVGATDGDLLEGFSVTVNNVAFSLASATASLNDDQTELTITATNFAYSDVVDVSYDSSSGTLYSWNSGAVPDFTLESLPNISTEGLPGSSYFLSYVEAPGVTVSANVVTALLNISLNPVDIILVARYGAQVLTGGTFGVTVQNPSGVTVSGTLANIVDGGQIKATFTSANVAWSVVAAQDWQAVITQNIGTVLSALRTADSAIAYNNSSTSAV